MRRVPLREQHAVEREYGLPAGLYGNALQIDHIVPLKLGGSNSIANLFPAEYAFADGSPGFVLKDRLEDRAHTMVCAGKISLRSAQRRMAANWERFYRQALGRSATHKTGSAHRHA